MLGGYPGRERDATDHPSTLIIISNLIFIIFIDVIQIQIKLLDVNYPSKLPKL